MFFRKSRLIKKLRADVARLTEENEQLKTEVFADPSKDVDDLPDLELLENRLLLKDRLDFCEELRTVLNNQCDFEKMYESAITGRLHRAMIGDFEILGLDVKSALRSGENVYYPTLTECTCPDFQTRGGVCKHMLYLAYTLGILQLGRSQVEAALKKIARTTRYPRQK